MPKLLFFLKLIISIYFSLLLIACDGGDDSNDDPVVTYLQVVNATPNADAIADISSSIRVEFSEKVKTESFINMDAPIGLILQEEGIQLSSTLATSFDVSSVTIRDLLNSKLYIPSIEDSRGEDIILIISEVRWDETGNDLVIVSTNFPNIIIKKQTLDKHNIFAQNVIRVIDENDERVLLNIIEESDDGRVFKLKPNSNFFKWNTTYNVVVDRVIRDINNRHMYQDYLFSFTTPPIPEAEISWVDPMGAEASVLVQLKVRPNFVVDEASLQGNIILQKVDVNGQITASEVSTVISYDKFNRVITVSPVEELEYTTDYKAIVLGGSSGLSGNFDGLMQAFLSEDFEWKFQTAPPKVMDTLPRPGAQDVHPEKTQQMIMVDFNFNPKESSINSDTLFVKDSYGNKLEYSLKVTDNKVYISPTANLEYNKNYTVTVTASVLSKKSSEIHLPEKYEFSFKTQSRKVVEVTPAENSTNSPLSAVFTAKFNFPVSAGSLNSSAVSVYSSEEKQGPFTREVPGQFVYTKNNRTLVFTPNHKLLYHTYVQVKISNSVMDESGEYLQEEKTWVYRTQNKDFDVASYYPTGDRVELDKTIHVKFNEKIDQSTIGRSNDSDPALEVSANCLNSHNSGKVSGDITWDDYTVFFRPNGGKLKSNCTYDIVVSENLQGAKNERQDGQQFAWAFDSDYLKINNVGADFLPGSKVVSAYTNFRVEFDHQILDSYDTRQGVYLRNKSTGSNVYGRVRVSGSTIEFKPSNPLRTSTEYKLYIKKDRVKGIDGEELQRDVTSTVKTEPVEVEVEDWYPTGNYVDVDDIIEITINVPVSSKGFDYDIEVMDEDGYSVSGDIREYNDTITFIPDDYELEYDTEYTVYFNVEYFDLSSSYDYEFDWSFVTEVSENSSLSKVQQATTNSSARRVKKMDSSAKDQRALIRSDLLIDVAESE